MESDRFGFSIKGKGGLVSSFIVFFGATIAIVLILIVFVLGAGVVKKWHNVGSDIAIFDESGVEIDDVFDYSDRYVLFNNARHSIVDGADIDVELEEAKRLAIVKKKEKLLENIP